MSIFSLPLYTPFSVQPILTLCLSSYLQGRIVPRGRVDVEDLHEFEGTDGQRVGLIRMPRQGLGRLPCRIKRASSSGCVSMCA
jgi:hypothetical protein